MTDEYEDQLDRLIDALAACIVAHQDKTDRERAMLVLGEIDAQGFGLLPHDELGRVLALLRDTERALAAFESVEADK